MKRLLPILLFVPAIACADESQVRLKDGPGRDLVAARCATCHSLDYLPMNSPFLDSASWEKEVDKMIRVMGAPIDPSEIPTLLRYLNTYYGR